MSWEWDSVFAGGSSEIVKKMSGREYFVVFGNNNSDNNRNITRGNTTAL